MLFLEDSEVGGLGVVDFEFGTHLSPSIFTPATTAVGNLDLLQQVGLRMLFEFFRGQPKKITQVTARVL